MVIAARLPLPHINQCPHCGSGFIALDKQDREPFCCVCGWRHAIRITEEQARNQFRCEAEFWNNLFASEEDPDAPQHTIPSKAVIESNQAMTRQ